VRLINKNEENNIFMILCAHINRPNTIIIENTIEIASVSPYPCQATINNINQNLLFSLLFIFFVSVFPFFVFYERGGIAHDGRGGRQIRRTYFICLFSTTMISISLIEEKKISKRLCYAISMYRHFPCGPFS
jgi:hypothetical protein